MELSLQAPPRAWPARPVIGSANWAWRLGAVLLIGAAAGLHIAYLAHDCPLELAADEAHYWDWSRHLDWSYYSKGPLVAYLIRCGTALAGSWARQITGNEMLAVRLPAVVCGSLLLVSLYVLTCQVYRREGLAFGVVAAALTLPIVATGSTLMTIDAPYTCCWGWALVAGYWAIFDERRWAWPLLGLIIGMGILAKYTMFLFLPSVGLFLSFAPARRYLLCTIRFWSMVAIAGFCCLPILVWNAQHGWVTFHHVGGQAGLSDSEGIRWLGPLTYVGTQLALFMGYWFIAWAAAIVRLRPWRNWSAATSYLWWLSLTTFGVFLLFSVRSDEEPNWPVAAYLSGLLLACAWISEQVRASSTAYRRLAQAFLCVFSLAGVALTVAMHHTDWLQPILLRVSGPPTTQQPMPLRRFDPSCRLRGWQTLAHAVDELRATLGSDVVLAGTSWTLPGELGFYCDGHPTVYSVGLAVGDRHSQYDLWRPNPCDDGEQFIGKNMIIVGDLGPALRDYFDRQDPPRTVVYYEHGEPVAEWKITVSYGLRGFPQAATTHF